MRALHFDGTDLRVTTREPPRPGPHEALIRVTCAGICNTDLEIVKGYMDFRGVLGHELVGVVTEGPKEWVDQRVTAEINFACGHCAACERGLGRHCPTRTVMGIAGADGALAELVAVPVANLHAVPKGLEDEAAVFTEPLAAAFEILEQVPLEPGERAIVLGDGKLGLLVAQVLSSAGARVLVIGRHEEKLALLRARGIEVVLAGHALPDPARLVVEATGSAEGLATAIGLTRPRGTLVLKSTVADRIPVDLAPVVIHEMAIVGSRCGPFPPALRALSRGSVSVAPLVSARFSLEDGLKAFERARAPGVLKVLIDVAQARP